MLAGAGLTLVAERDLSPLLQVRGMPEVAPRLAELRRGLRFRLGLDVRAEAEVGGLLLESLQTDGWVSYRLLVARKPAVSAT
jgi:hypothetical protein